MHWKYVYFHHLKSENEALSQSWWCTLWDDSRSLHPSLQCGVGDLPTGPHLSLPLLAWSHLLKCGWMDVELRSCFLQLPSPLQSYAAPSFRIKVNLIRMHWNMLTVCVGISYTESLSVSIWSVYLWGSGLLWNSVQSLMIMTTIMKYDWWFPDFSSGRWIFVVFSEESQKTIWWFAVKFDLSFISYSEWFARKWSYLNFISCTILIWIILCIPD